MGAGSSKWAVSDRAYGRRCAVALRGPESTPSLQHQRSCGLGCRRCAGCDSTSAAGTRPASPAKPGSPRSAPVIGFGVGLLGGLDPLDVPAAVAGAADAPGLIGLAARARSTRGARERSVARGPLPIRFTLVRLAPFRRRRAAVTALASPSENASRALRKKRGLEITSPKNEAGERVYRIADARRVIATPNRAAAIQLAAALVGSG